MKKNTLYAILLLILPTLCFAAEIRIGFTSGPQTLDPANHRSRETETIIRNMYDGLVTRSSTMEIVPQIAESWRVVNSKTFDFTLRKGVTFHDGSPVSVRDIKFTFDRLIREDSISGKTSPRKNLLGPLNRIILLNDHMVRFIFDKPWPQFLGMLSFQQIVSRSFIKKEGDATMSLLTNGTGPFRLSRWVKDDVLIMERYEDYYGGSTRLPPVGKACVDRAVFRIIPNNESRVAGLLSGDVDIINNVPTHSVEYINRSRHAKVMTVNGTRSFFLALNNLEKPFNDIRVRKAVAHAIDKQSIITSTLDGNAVSINGILSPDTFVDQKALTHYEFNPKTTRTLLMEAGYPDGIDITLDVEPDLNEIAQEIARYLINEGIRTKIIIGSSERIKNKWRTMGKQKNGEMWLTSWGNSSLDPIGIMDPTHGSNKRGNSSGYSNPLLDQLLDQAASEKNPSHRLELYAQAESIINRDLPCIYLWVPKELYGVSNRVFGWQPGPDGRMNLHDVCIRVSLNQND